MHTEAAIFAGNKQEKNILFYHQEQIPEAGRFFKAWNFNQSLQAIPAAAETAMGLDCFFFPTKGSRRETQSGFSLLEGSQNWLTFSLHT